VGRHDTIGGSGMEEEEGYLSERLGDSFHAAFASPYQALSAALASQRALLAEQWPAETGTLKVRMALHTGAVEEQAGDYFGQPVNRVGRILAAGHGGQVL